MPHEAMSPPAATGGARNALSCWLAEKHPEVTLLAIKNQAKSLAARLASIDPVAVAAVILLIAEGAL